MNNLSHKNNQLAAYNEFIKKNSSLAEEHVWLTLPIIIWVTVYSFYLLALEEVTNYLEDN